MSPRWPRLHTSQLLPNCVTTSKAHIQALNTASFTWKDCDIAGYARPAQSAKYPVLPAAFSAVSVLDVDKLGPMVPQSFMGFSHEWPNVEEMTDIPQYVDVIKLLQSYGSGPLSLRIGGGSTDMQKTVPGPAVWDSLSKLHKATGMTYILGLNFFDQNVELARNQMDAARKGLPEGSIQSFEIGNEVSRVREISSATACNVHSSSSSRIDGTIPALTG